VRNSPGTERIPSFLFFFLFEVSINAKELNEDEIFDSIQNPITNIYIYDIEVWQIYFL
jgi:hypothetical protein